MKIQDSGGKSKEWMPKRGLLGNLDYLNCLTERRLKHQGFKFNAIRS